MGLPVSPSSLVANAYDAYPPPHVACPIHLILRLACRAMSSPARHPAVSVNGDCDGNDWAFISSSDGDTSSAPCIRFVKPPCSCQIPEFPSAPVPSPCLLVPPPLSLGEPPFPPQGCPPLCPSTAALAIALQPGDHGRVRRQLTTKTTDLKSGRNQTTTTVKMVMLRRHCSGVVDHWGFPNLEGAASSGRAKTRGRDKIWMASRRRYDRHPLLLKRNKRPDTTQPSVFDDQNLASQYHPKPEW